MRRCSFTGGTGLSRITRWRSSTATSSFAPSAKGPARFNGLLLRARSSTSKHLALSKGGGPDLVPRLRRSYPLGRSSPALPGWADVWRSALRAWYPQGIFAVSSLYLPSATIRSLIESPPFRLSSRLSRRAVEQLACLWQVEKEMENSDGCEARRAGRQTSAQPGRAGINPQEDMSAVGAAWNLGPLPSAISIWESYDREG